MAGLIVTKQLINKGLADSGGQGIKMILGTIDFDASYPTGGEALDFSADIPDLKAVFIETKGGYVFEYNYTTKKVIAYNGPIAHTHDVKLIGGITAAEPVAVYGGDTLGKNAATDRTIAGADSASKGGIVASAVGATAQVTASTDLSTIVGVAYLAIGF